MTTMWEKPPLIYASEPLVLFAQSGWVTHSPFWLRGGCAAACREKLRLQPQEREKHSEAFIQKHELKLHKKHRAGLAPRVRVGNEINKSLLCDLSMGTVELGGSQNDWPHVFGDAWQSRDSNATKKGKRDPGACTRRELCWSYHSVHPPQGLVWQGDTHKH